MQTGAGPIRIVFVSPRARPMKISGITMFSYFIVWCSPIQNSVKPRLLGADDELQVFVVALGRGLGGVVEGHDEHAVANRRGVPVLAHGSSFWRMHSGGCSIVGTS